MPAFFDLLRYASVAALGVFAGAMLTEGGVLVPFWRSLAPAEFLRWYGANADRLLAFFSPVTSVSAVIALLAAIGSLWEGHPGRWWSVLAATLVLVTVASFFVYFEHANTSFATAAIAVDAVPAELARWSTWHNARTAVSVVALGAALLAVRQSP
ncbi:MAG: hypothetical protein ABIR79_04260 [Candidatus Binatia bacterium]